MMQYLTAPVEHMRDEDFTSMMIVKAIKGRNTGGYEKTLVFDEKRYTFGPKKGDPAIDL